MARSKNKTDKKPAAPPPAAEERRPPSEQRVEASDMRRRIPSLDSYLTRIGAEELNFRRYMVKDHRGSDHYYVEKTLIKINADGTIYCSRKEHDPTEDERKKILEAFLKIDVPRSVGASRAAAEAKARELTGQAFLFYDRGQKSVTMLQERWQREDGGKVYVPWTLWSDGEWRRMEPDSDLPFWKPLTDRRRAAKMVHEGAKVASHIDDLVNNPDRREELEHHPWGKVLSLYEHWGMIGGALAPHRSDYAELVREKPTEAVYVCDNDFAGEAALQDVARCYGHSLLGIFFGESFPGSWDMADPIPDGLFVGGKRGRRYVGPRLEDLMLPATRATEVIPNPLGKGRSVVVLRRPFKEEWLHSMRPEVYIHRDWPHEMWTMPEFNSKVRPFSDVDDTARLLRGEAASKSAVIKYDPSQPPGVYGSGDDGRYINTHRPSSIRAEEGEVQPWLEFIGDLCPEEHDRTELVRWCCTLVARPAVKMTYGVLLISETQGVGKGTLGEKILAPLIGTSNVSFPSEQEIVDSNFNYWLAHKRMAVVHEIYAGHSSKAYNRLKSVVTDRYLTINKKHMSVYDIENWMHVFACSNSMRAIQLTMDDRRWLLPRIAERKKPKAYWQELNRWLREDGGLERIRWWMEDWLERNSPVLAGEDAPWTSIKKEVVEEGYSPGMQLVARTLDRITSILEGTEEEERTTREKWRSDGMLGPGGEVLVLDVELVRLIFDVVHQGRPTDRLERPLTMRKLAKSRGWHAGTVKVSTGMMTWGATAHNGHVISNSADVAAISPAELGGRKAAGPIKLRPLSLDWARTI